MAADGPTILATSGGLVSDPRTYVRPGPLLEHALELARPEGRPRLCLIGTAGGDQLGWNGIMHAAFTGRGVELTCLDLFPMPSVADPAAHLLAQDAIWVGGGSTANLLAIWRLHGLDRILRDCWEEGVVLAGVSAGLVYRGTELVEAVSETRGAGAYRVERRAGGGVDETRIEPRLLDGAAN